MDKINSWFNSAVGRAMNPDGAYGLQCKDVADDYCVHLFGNWINTIRPGDALRGFDNANPDFFDKIRNNPSDANQRPLKGDIIIWDGWTANPYGHIAVVEGATTSSITVIEQDGYLQIPAYIKTRGWYLGGKLPIGWLRPRLNKIIGASSPGGSTVEIVKSMFWRLLGREASAEDIKNFTWGIENKGAQVIYEEIKNSPEGQKDWKWRNPDRVRGLEKTISEQTAEITRLKAELEAEKSKPAVIKEVEVIKEAPVDEKAVVENWLIRLWKRLFNK